MTNKTRAGASVLMALGGLMAAWLLLAGPAGADPSSVGPNAENNSVSSGAATAINDSVASGHARAEDGSVSSGCASAEDESTASGGSCRHHDDKDHEAEAAKAAKVATPVAAKSLAFTGTSTTGPLALVAGAFLVLGTALVVGSRRIQSAQR